MEPHREPGSILLNEKSFLFISLRLLFFRSGWNFEKPVYRPQYLLVLIIPKLKLICGASSSH